ncbi:MAG: hypothetical protein ACFE0Q_21520 [Anaerolineae bacterium]
MSEQQSPTQGHRERETGAIIHRRETNWQIYLPFLLGILTLVIVFLVMALPTDALWRYRAQALGDFLYTLLCVIPILFCLLPVYVLILLGVYGMKRLHSGTERPLRKLEKLSESLASRIETATEFVNQKTISFSSALEPLEKLFSIFDRPTPSSSEEESAHDK